MFRTACAFNIILGTLAGAVLALFLALAAIQFVVSQSLPASSYVTPVGQVSASQNAGSHWASANEPRFEAAEAPPVA